MADGHPATPGVGRARRHRYLVVAATTLLSTTACGSDQRDEPTIRVIEEAPADGGVVTERIVDGVLVRAVVERDELCVWVTTPPRSADPADTGSGGCGPLALLDAILARDGAWSTSTADDRWSVFAALVPDGYDEAHSSDGRRWEIADNLLILVRSAADPGAWPEELRLVGEGRPRTVDVHDPRD